jgi:hypothetical protein
VLLLVATELTGLALTYITWTPFRLFSITVDPGIIWTPFEVLSRNVKPGKYDSLAAAAVTAEATFLALYYATIGVVASTAYSSVRRDIRELFVHERTSNVYTRGIVRAFVFTAVLTTMGALDCPARALTLVAATVLAIVAALRLMIVGTAPFSFFDPAALTESLPARFQRALRLASTLPTATDEGSQVQAHREAVDVLQYYRQITDLVPGRSVPNSEAPLRVARQLLELNARYSAVKDLIPSESRWWSSIAKYPNWFTLSSTQIESALNTSTGAQGTADNDHLWVERQSASDIAQLLGNLTSLQLNQFTNFVDEATTHIRLLSRRLQSAEAELFEEQLAAAIWAAVNSQPIGDDDERRAHQQDRVIASQRSVLLLTNAWLGLVDVATLLRDRDLAANTDEAIADKRRIYEVSFPRPVVRLLEDLIDLIEMEKKIEGRRVTPSWWIHHQVARTLTTHFLKSHNVVATRFSTRTLPALTSAIENEDWEVAAMTALAALELVSKIEVHSGTVRSALAALETRRSAAIDDPHWPVITDEPAVDPNARTEILEILSRCLPHLNVEPHVSTKLDLYGQTYVFVFNGTFDAILDNNVEHAAKLFTALFAQASRATARIVRDLENALPRAQMIYGLEPVVGMMELSGYAILLQELNGRGVWDLIRPHWESNRESRGDAFIRYLVDVIADADRGFMLTDPYIMRTARQQRLDRLLEERGITAPHDFPWPTDEESTPKRDISPIVAAFAPGDFGAPWKLTDLFLATYVRPFLPEDVSLPPSAEALATTISDEEDTDSDA